jgi:hypothetical protein
VWCGLALLISIPPLTGDVLVLKSRNVDANDQARGIPENHPNLCRDLKRAKNIQLTARRQLQESAKCNYK